MPGRRRPKQDEETQASRHADAAFRGALGGSSYVPAPVPDEFPPALREESPLLLRQDIQHGTGECIYFYMHYKPVRDSLRVFVADSYVRERGEWVWDDYRDGDDYRARIRFHTPPDPWVPVVMQYASADETRLLAGGLDLDFYPDIRIKDFVNPVPDRSLRQFWPRPPRYDWTDHNEAVPWWYVVGHRATGFPIKIIDHVEGPHTVGRGEAFSRGRVVWAGNDWWYTTPSGGGELPDGTPNIPFLQTAGPPIAPESSGSLVTPDTTASVGRDVNLDSYFLVRDFGKMLMWNMGTYMEFSFYFQFDTTGGKPHNAYIQLFSYNVDTAFFGGSPFGYLYLNWLNSGPTEFYWEDANSEAYGFVEDGVTVDRLWCDGNVHKFTFRLDLEKEEASYDFDGRFGATLTDGTTAVKDIFATMKNRKYYHPWAERGYYYNTSRAAALGIAITMWGGPDDLPAGTRTLIVDDVRIRSDVPWAKDRPYYD